MAIYKDVSSLELVSFTEPENSTFTDGVDFILEKLDDIPEADVEPIVHAYWEEETEVPIALPYGEEILIERKCSNCHKWSDKEILVYYPAPAKYCSACGAKMDVGKNEN